MKKTIVNGWIFLLHLSLIIFSTRLSAQNMNIYFEQIRNQEVLLQQFFAGMPKGGDLHNHLTGSVYAETYFNIAEEKQLKLDTITFVLYDSARKCSSCITVKPDMPDRHKYLVRCIDEWSIRNFQPAKQTLPPDEFFFAAFGKFGASTSDLVPLLKELRLRAKAENVQYLEVMVTSPRVKLDLPTERKALIETIRTKGNIDLLLESIYNDWEKGYFKTDIENYITLIKKVDENSKDAAPDVVSYYQTYAARNNPDPLTVFAQLYIGFKSCMQYNKLVGVNIVQAENGDYGLRDYWGHMKMYQFLKSKMNTVKASLHAGELCMGLTPPEDLQTHITEAVRIAKADRIGHGVDIAYEKNSDSLLKEMAQKKIAVEINLTSNQFILGVKNSAHPIMLYHKNKVPMVIATDDPGILRSNLTQEFVTAALRYPELKYSDFRQFILNSIEYSFMPPEVKRQEREKLEVALRAFEQKPTPSPGSIYTISSVADPEKVLDVKDKAEKPGTKVILFSYNHGANQKWKIELAKEENGVTYYFLKPQHKPEFVLDVSEVITLSGAETIIYTKKNVNNDNQLWQIVYVRDGCYMLVPKNAPDMALGLKMISDTEIRAALEKQNAQNTQLWQFAPTN